MNVFRNPFSSIVGAVVGILFFVGSFPLIFWNENRSVQTERSLSEGQDSFVSTSCDVLDPANDGKLVYVNGNATSANPLVDSATRIPVPALMLRRDSEMYQWIEKSEKPAGSKEPVYSYEMGWKRGLDKHQGKGGGHINPVSYTLPSGTDTVTEANLGKLRVSPAILHKIGPFRQYSPDEKALKAVPESLRNRLQISGSSLYLGKNPSWPEIGDERINFNILPPCMISVIARQSGGSLASHTTSNGREILLARAGIVTADAMFERAFSTNKVLTWVLRAVGAIVMFIGMRMIVEPLTNIVQWVPLVGGLADLGATLASAVLAVSLSLVTISIAWFAVRPLLSGFLIVIAGGIIFLVRSLRPR